MLPARAIAEPIERRNIHLAIVAAMANSAGLSLHQDASGVRLRCHDLIQAALIQLSRPELSLRRLHPDRRETTEREVVVVVAGREEPRQESRGPLLHEAPPRGWHEGRYSMNSERP